MHFSQKSQNTFLQHYICFTFSYYHHYFFVIVQSLYTDYIVAETKTGGGSFSAPPNSIINRLSEMQCQEKKAKKGTVIMF